MATAVQSIAYRTTPLGWFWQFLRDELSPYPGRAALVGRMILAATIVMVINMTFRIPYGAYAAMYGLILSRESPQATVEAAKTMLSGFAFSVIYLLIGAFFFLADPQLRLFWVIGTFFVMFYALRVMANYTAAARFGYLLIITIPLWDRHISANEKVEGTLWAFGAISLASVIAALLELAFAKLMPRDDLLQSIGERLAVIEELMDCYISQHSVDSKTEQQITNFAMVGTSRLRRNLQRSSYATSYAEQMGAVVALVGRLVDIAANLTNFRFEVSDDAREQLLKTKSEIARIRVALLERKVPSPSQNGETITHIPLMSELQTTLFMIPAVFCGSKSLAAYAPQSTQGEPRFKMFVPDAFSNPEHIKFALRGCLASSLCYIIYNAKEWPGINTAITTCFLTALSTVGASHQKQIVRIAGALVGGLILGIGSQVFVLPHLDSITGFTLLFLAVSIPAAWFATSGPRLSYFGVQIAISFYLVNLSEFRVQTSLEPGRDRVIGILLGLSMMWLAFDTLWTTSAATEMKNKFLTTLRLLAQFSREPGTKDLRAAIERKDSLRETINKNFDSVRASADAVLFEFGPSRRQELAWRTKIREWQPQLRLFFLTEIVLWKYRARLPGFELPPAVRVAQQEFDGQSAKTVDRIADCMEGKAKVETADLENAFERLKKVALTHSRGSPNLATDQLQTFLSLCVTIKDLDFLNERI
jgi:multidrug resistance protein MdtO